MFSHIPGWLNAMLCKMLQYKMNNQDLCLMWLSVWCSILQSMAFNQPGIWLNIFLRHLTGLRQRRLCNPWPTQPYCPLLRSAFG